MFSGHALHSTRLLSPDPVVAEHRADLDHPITPHDLVGFARCPRRWVDGQPERPVRGYAFGDLVRCILLGGSRARAGIVRRPETFDDVVLECPNCKSVSKSRLCTKCNLGRRQVTLQREWVGSAKACQTWTAQIKQSGILPITPRDFDAAMDAAAAARNDKDVAALLDNSQLGQSGSVDYTHEATGTKIHLYDRIDIVPNEGHALDCALAHVHVCFDAAHNASTATTHYAYGHMRAALALEIINHTLLPDAREALQVLIENKPPYLISRRRLDASLLTAGRKLLEETLEMLALCRHSKTYPSFDTSAPGTLNGWTTVTHDPSIQEANEKTDARFAIQAVRSAVASTAH